MKKKLFIVLCVTAFFLAAASLVTSYMDSARVRNSVEPKFAVKIVSEDGTKVTYWGLGYKVIRYPSASPDEPYKNNRGVKYGNWFMKYELPADDKIFNRVWYSDFAGIYVQVTDIYVDSEKATMTVSWNNETDLSVTYGEMFRIERLENGEWTDCSLNENSFIAIAYLLNSNESVSKEYNLTDMYDVSKPGTYRFHAACTVAADNEQPSPCSVWTEFIIE